ncbi:MAG: radical SAM protein, partial [Spirochaetaceae bacterium]|nr:radical SAM protein [Spirochaetaceae bacterium]
MIRPFSSLRRGAFRAHRDLEIREHALLYLFLEITRRCNLSCLHCGSDCARDAAFPELDAESWLSAIDYMKERYDPFFVITGGEPLASPDLEAITDRLGDRAARWGMVTNGMALEKGIFGRLVERGMSSMTVSLDGLAASHNLLRRNPAAFERALAAIELVGRSSLEFRDAVTCVWEANLAELGGIGELLAARGMNSWRLFRIFPKGRAADRPDLRLDREGTSCLLEWIAENRPLFAAKGLVLSYSCEGYVGMEMDRRIRDEPFFCRAGVNIASILCDGKVTGCNNNGSEFIQGDLADDDFSEIWERRFEVYRDRTWARTGSCADCA